MPCQLVRTSTGSAIVCGPRSRAKPKPCWECPRPGSFQCDGPSPTGKGDCNRPLCAHHRTPASAGVDYCRDHAGTLRLL